MTPLTLLGRPVRTPYDRIGYVVRIVGEHATVAGCIDDPPDPVTWAPFTFVAVSELEPIDRGMAFGGAN